MKIFYFFFKHIDVKTIPEALDDIRFEFQEHSQAANSKIKDLQHKFGFNKLQKQITEKVEAPFL